MKPDDINKAFDSVYLGIAALQSFARLLTDARHTQMPAEDVGQVLDFMSAAVSERMDGIQGAFHDQVLPFYRDFQSAKEAMRGSHKA